MLGPQVDWYLEKTDQLLSRDPRFVISQHNYTAIPMLIGICSNEGAFMRGNLRIPTTFHYYSNS